MEKQENSQNNKNDNVDYKLCEKSRQDGIKLFDDPVIRAVFERLKDK